MSHTSPPTTPSCTVRSKQVGAKPHFSVSTVTTIEQELENHTSVCKQAGIASARLCVELVAAATLDCPRLLIHERRTQAFTKEQQREITDRIQKLLCGAPLQYVLGEVSFYGYQITVDRDVLIPRPETEEVLTAVLALSCWDNKQEVSVIDVGTGSGCMAIALALEKERVQTLGIDVSKAALSVAQTNVLAHRLEQRVTLRCGDLLAGCAPQSVDLVISNPPYVSDADYLGLDPTIRDFEPKVALWGGVDGLDIYRRLIPQAAQVLLPGGWIVLEMGTGQRGPVESLLKNSGFVEIVGSSDMNGHDRIVQAKFP